MNNHNELIINLEGIFFKYPGNDTNVIDNLDLKFYRGNRIGLRHLTAAAKPPYFILLWDF